MQLQRWKRPVELQIHHIKPWGPACVVWIDLKGSKELLASGRTDELNKAGEALHTVATSLARSHPGEFIRQDGDAVLFVFDNRHTIQAVEFTIAFQQQFTSSQKSTGWRCAAAVTSGLVARSSTECDGPTIELAHSIAVAGSPNSIFVDYAARTTMLKDRGSGAKLRLARPRELLARNFDEPTVIFEIIWSDKEHGLRPEWLER